MRRVALVVLPLLLVTACSGGTKEGGDDPVVSAVSAAPSASAGPLEGLEVLPGDQSREHKPGDLDYDRSPPLGGDHNIRWLACDVYDEPVLEEFAVHSLEHGAVWLTYQPGLAQDEVAVLQRLADLNEQYVLVSPYEGLSSPVAAVAWGRELQVERTDDPRLAQFVRQFAGGAQGGEPGVPCRTQGLTPREAAGQLGDATT